MACNGQQGLDALCIVEHWLPQPQIETINFGQFFLAANYSRMSSLRGGTCILLADKWRNGFKVRPDLMTRNTDFHFEISAIELIEAKVIILCLYRSPSNGSRLIFLDSLSWVLEQIAREGKGVAVAGDFNFNFLSPNDSAPLVDLMLSHRLLKTVQVATRITATSQTSLDNIFTNLCHENIRVVETGMSDHMAIYLSLAIPKIRSNKNYPGEGRKINSSTLKCLNEILSTINWQNIYDLHETDVMFESFIQRFQSALDLACPFTTFRKNKQMPVSQALLSLYSKMKDVNILRASCSDQHLKSKLRKKYRLLKRLAENTLKDFNAERIKNSTNIGKGAWNLIKEKVHTKPASSGPSKLIVNGKQITEPTAMASHFIRHFSQLPGVPDSTKDDNPLDIMKVSVASPVESFSLSPTSLQELTRICSKMKNSRSVDAYGMSAHILKNCWPTVGPGVTELVNRVLQTGIFPKCLKTSEVVPVQKKGDKSQVNNWRAISICPILSKLIEKVICDRLLTYLAKHKILSSQQFGFRQKLSTNEALFHFLSQLYDKVDNKNTVGGIYCDLSRAFEMVPHNLLLGKLNYYGIRGLPLELFTSYLQGRTQRVRLRSPTTGQIVYSNSVLVEQGVPAGSVAGPLLFILFVNDLPAFLIKLCLMVFTICVALFADDTSLLVSAPAGTDICQITSVALTRAQEWFTANKLLLNASKTVLLNFEKSKLANQMVSHNGHNILFSDKTKFLGLTVNASLTWSDHIDQLCSRLMSGLYLLRTLSSQVKEDTLKLVYHSCFESHLAYGIIFWYGSPGYQIDKLFVIQKRAIRIICRVHPRTHCKPLFLKMNILTLPALYVMHLLMFTRRNQSLFEWKESRNGRLMQGLRVHFEKFRFSPQYRAIAVFNSLNKNMREEFKGSNFRGMLHKALVNMAPYSIPSQICSDSAN